MLFNNPCNTYIYVFPQDPSFSKTVFLAYYYLTSQYQQNLFANRTVTSEIVIELSPPSFYQSKLFIPAAIYFPGFQSPLLYKRCLGIRIAIPIMLIFLPQLKFHLFIGLRNFLMFIQIISKI